MSSMIRVFLLTVGLALLTPGCGTTMPPKCQPSNCSGCCTAENECIGVMRQSRTVCGTAGKECAACLPDQVCSQAGRCVADPNATGGGAGGGASGGGEAGGQAGGAGGGTTCGGEGEACCAQGTCNLTLTCSRALCLRCGMTNQPCCGGLCQGSNLCMGGTCVFPSAGGGTAGGATAGGAAGGSSGGTAGGSAGGSALLSIGDPCSLPSECAAPGVGRQALCLIAGFDQGYCSASCTSDTDCPFGSHCGRNPAGGGQVCLKRCMNPGTTGTGSGCRASYVCDRGGTSLINVPVCFPSCAAASQCGPGATDCDSRGFCCGAAPYACCENSTCNSGFTCTSGYCTPSGGTGGGGAGGGSATAGGSATGGGSATAGGSAGLGNVGDGCNTSLINFNGVCVGGAQARCPPVWANDPSWPGGYCSIAGCTASASDGSNDTCPAGSSCAINYGGNNHCLRNCDFATQSGCRTGYLCERGLGGNFFQGQCFPRCTATNGQCPSGTRCDPNGHCCGSAGFKCCTTGAACGSGLSCQTNLGGYCFPP